MSEGRDSVAGFERVWRFRAAPGLEHDFEQFNGSDGAWAKLFALAPGYLGTELRRVTDTPAEYLITDRWQSRADWEAFRAAHANAYEELDRRGEAFTVSEEPIRERDL